MKRKTWDFGDTFNNTDASKIWGCKYHQPQTFKEQH